MSPGNWSAPASPTRVLRPRGAPPTAGKIPARKAAPGRSRPAQLLALKPQPAQASPPLLTAHLPGHPAEPHDAQFKVGHGRACALGRRSRSLGRLRTGPGRSEAAALRVRPGPGSGRAGRGRTRLGRARATAAASRPPDLPRAAATERTPASGAEGGARPGHTPTGGGRPIARRALRRSWRAATKRPMGIGNRRRRNEKEPSAGGVGMG